MRYLTDMLWYLSLNVYFEQNCESYHCTLSACVLCNIWVFVGIVVHSRNFCTFHEFFVHFKILSAFQKFLVHCYCQIEIINKGFTVYGCQKIE